MFKFWKPKVYVTRWRVDTQYYKCAVPMPVKEGFESELDALNYRANLIKKLYQRLKKEA